MNENYKEELSQHVEQIFKEYTLPGLHICDLATGGGKSYTIGKLTCEYYPHYFDRIVILCVQNKLVLNMDNEIEKFINSPQSVLKCDDKLIIENNIEVICEAVRNGNLEYLIEDMEYQIGEQKRKCQTIDKRLCSICNSVKTGYKSFKPLLETYESNKNEEIEKLIRKGEENLRRSIRNFIDVWKSHLEKTKQYTRVSFDAVKRLFPNLVKVYPQIECRNKKVLLMTIHKAMYGIDPILSERVDLQNLTSKNKKTLILFDESDMAAVAMRDTIIEQSKEIRINDRRKWYTSGYDCYLQYVDLIRSPELIAKEYHGQLLEESLLRAKRKTEENWRQVFGNAMHCKNIFLNTRDDIETYRRGVFFSGPVVNLNIGPIKDNTNTYICCRENDRQFTLVHSKDKENLESSFQKVVPMIKFIDLANRNTTIIKSSMWAVAKDALEKNMERFKREEKAIASNTAETNQYLGYPTMEREVHTLLSRFGTNAENLFEQQLLDFIRNRKNITIQGGEGKNYKFPDYSVYFQGVRLYQEDIDEKDNQRRVRLTCREITTTPEKILYNLISSGTTTVVLCSATASNTSVVSNFDIQYIERILCSKTHKLSDSDRTRFDELVENTYPKDHQVEIVPIQRYEYPDKREMAITLPDKYRELFCIEAQNEGLVDEWFRCTKRLLVSNRKGDEDITYHLYRLFQFAEAYKWFMDHEDVHSMIYFQNTTGYENKEQIHVISCLIDGTYKDQKSCLDGKLPNDWTNIHIRISKEWEEVESNVLRELGQDKNAKIMLVAAYNSFKAGTNLQYNIPKGLNYLKGDNWDEDKLEKDWDAIFLQCPTAYLMMTDDESDYNYEKSLYNSMLVLMMLFERGCLSKWEVRQWLHNALANNLFFSEKISPGIISDKSAWVQSIVEQAVGRLCRTKNKPRRTYILYDESMSSYFSTINMRMSLTKEFRALATYILEHPLKEENENNPDEIMRCNCANYVYEQLGRLLNRAYYHTRNIEDLDGNDYDEEEDIPHNVMVEQEMMQSFKNTIIKKPVISNYEELEDSDRRLTFIDKCYGDWERNVKNEYIFHYEKERNKLVLCPNNKGKMYPWPISPSTVRLDVLMRNNIIREYFEKNGYATDWRQGGLILHPNILMYHYSGEIGEEAFKAIVLHYTDCTEKNFVHLKGKDYELADYVVLGPDERYKIAFDVKNMNPRIRHDDRIGDIPTTDKRQNKKELLGCEVITVNMLKMDGSSMDDNREILGLIDENGVIIPDSIERLRHLIND